MVLVTVGTQKQEFDRLFDIIRNSKELKKENLVIQRGYTKCNNSKRIKAFDFISLEKMEEYISEADLIISHGGVGTIFSAIKKGKKVIAIPRLAKYGEHINDHQIEICEALEKEGYILYYKDGIDNLDDLIKKVRKTEFEKYDSNDNYIDILRKEI
jgi:UDP-N-acetylglucosamine transferase subunit ALG13